MSSSFQFSVLILPAIAFCCFIFRLNALRSYGKLSSKVARVFGSSLKAQSLDYTSLYLSVAELNLLFVPGKVENVIQNDDYSLFLGVKTLHGPSVWLQFCWHPVAARIGLGLAPPKIDSSTPYSFASTLRALLKGQSVTCVKVPTPFERVAEVHFSERISDPHPKWRLLVEILGTKSNVILLSHDDNVIQACAYQVSSAASRPLQTSMKYISPPQGGGVFSPLLEDTSSSSSAAVISYEMFAKRITEIDVPIEKALVKYYKGMSPNVAHRILSHAGLGDDNFNVSAKQLSEEQVRNIFFLFRDWAAIFTAGVSNIDGGSVCRGQGKDEGNDDGEGQQHCNKLIIRPGIFDTATSASSSSGSKKKSTEEYCTVDFMLPAVRGGTTGTELEQADNAIDTEEGSQIIKGPFDAPVARFLQNYYSMFERRLELDTLRSSCERTLQVRQKRAHKIYHDFSRQLEEARGEKGDELKYRGDLITSFTHAWEPKSATLQCYDFITGEPVLIALTPGKTPSDYAQQLYKKSRKLKRSVKVLESLIGKIKQHVDYLNEIETSLESFSATGNGYVSYEDVSTVREIGEELGGLEELTIVQKGDADFVDDQISSSGSSSIRSEAAATAGSSSGSSYPGDRSSQQAKTTAKGKPGTSKVKTNNKNTGGKSSGKNGNSSKKGNTAAASGSSSSRKKVMQGLLVVRPTGIILKGNIAKITGENRDDDTDLPPLVVGRSSKQNDRVSFEIAKDHHLWFHVQGAPGSHCLLQLEPGETATKEALQYAADVAAYFSKSRGSTHQVPVGYCSPKYVKRISGGPPGLVSILQQQGVAYGSPDRGKQWVDQYGPSVQPREL